MGELQYRCITIVRQKKQQLRPKGMHSTGAHEAFMLPWLRREI
jgi:hypothetical protein